MRLSITFAFLLNFIAPLKAIAQYTTRYTYDENGNVTSRRDIGYASHRAARELAVADTASLANIYYDGDNSTLTIKLNNATPYATTAVNIYNATTRLKVGAFSFDTPIYTYSMGTYPQGIYIIEATCGENTAAKKITR